MMIKQKPLIKVWRAFPDIDRDRTLIIDDMEEVCIQDAEHQILIPPWCGSLDSVHKHDDSLLNLSNWMKNKLPVSSDYKRVSTKGLFDSYSGCV
jgi:TFIIF-interacting CTD phosphatase-like protein